MYPKAEEILRISLVEFLWLRGTAMPVKIEISQPLANHRSDRAVGVHDVRATQWLGFTLCRRTDSATKLRRGLLDFGLTQTRCGMYIWCD